MPAESPEPILDRQRIDSIRGMPGWGESCFQAAGGVFLTQAADLLQQLDRALAAGDTEALHRTAHTLKGSSASVGLSRLARTAGDLMTAVSNRHVERFAPLSRIVQEEATRGCAALRSELDNGHGTSP